MHSKKSSRWLKLLLSTVGITALVGVAFTMPSQAVSPNPTPVCSEGTCWVTFDYSGDNYVWTPPSKINSLHFDVFGAQGGRSGGKGGSVSGDFAVIPSMLYVFVGGMGYSANSAPGGFNGGGTSGNGHGDQGSGGGASDLRTTANLSDRVVVAGGGGGTGGWIGGVGGPGGLTIASAGTKGSPSGTAGGGGTQVSGGSAGLGVTTGNGGSGSFGIGGVGGSGTVAGGGGGGGGFYGGGGGGADSVSGGSDGAGGGGGSSFATMALTSSVTHQSGVKPGNGQVVLRYTFAPSATAFALTSPPNSVNGAATFQVTFDQLTYDLDPFDFKLYGTASGCQVVSTSGDGYTFQVQVAGCSSGTLALSLRPQAIMGATLGPVIETFAAGEVTFDSLLPGFSLTAPSSPSNASFLTFRLNSTEAFIKPAPTAFELTGSGCQLANISMVAVDAAEIQITGCQSSANVRLKLLPNQVRDLAGNTGPALTIASADVVVDREAPRVITNQLVSSSADLLEYVIGFNEAVTGLRTDSFTASSGCTISKLDGSADQYRVWLVGCSNSGNLTLKTLTASDAAGNLGPVTEQNAVGNSDKTSPNAAITELTRTEKSLSPSFELRFDELVAGFSLSALSKSGTSKNCTFTISAVTAGSVYRIDSSGCSSGSLRVSVLANSVTDLQGNPGPLVQADSQIIRIAELRPEIQAASRSNLTPLKAAAPKRIQPVVAPKVKREPTASTPAAESETTASLESLKPESWVSLAIALLALSIAKRTRGRRAIRR
jgi:hypothetical protein